MGIPPERRIAVSLNRPLVRYAALRGRQGPTDLQANIGSVAHIARDSLRDSMVLVGLHEQTHTPEFVCSSYVIVCPCSRSKRVQGQVCVVPTLGICPARSVTAPALIPVSNG